MKKVTLIGDSIRMGYQDLVREMLTGRAEVWAPAENGAETVNVLKYAHLWLLRQPADIVHINAGLHDLKTVHLGRRENLVPVEQYRRNVRLILEIITGEMPAKAIWALTTPVLEQRHNEKHRQWGDFARYNEDVVRYNDAARDVCQQMSVPVDDLYAAVIDDIESLQTPDGVHFEPAGSQRLAEAVVESIRSAGGF